MVITKSRVFLFLSFALSLGLSFGIYLNGPHYIIGVIVLLIIVSVFWSSKIVYIFFFVGFMFLVSGYWSKVNQPPSLDSYLNRTVEMKIVIVEDPDVKEESASFTGQLIEINNNKHSELLFVTIPRYPSYEYGTELTIKGKIKPLSEYRLKENASGEISRPQVISSAINSGSKFKRQLFLLKHKLLRASGEMLPEPQAGLLSGLLLGVRGLPESLLEQFRITGTSHIIAVSGFNVTIVASALDKMFRSFGRSFSFYSSVFAIISFVIITGASASIVRAGIMGCVVLLAQHMGRMYSSVNAIVFTSALMLVQNPKLLQFDIGFQLSFAALAGLMFVQPKFEEYISNKFLNNYVMPTIAAQITTAPIILYHFGNLSLVSVLSNFLVLPAISLTMFLGFGALMVFLAFPLLGKILAIIPWLLLTYIVKAIEITSSIPNASLDELKFPFWLLVVYYILLIVALKWKSKQKTLLNT